MQLALTAISTYCAVNDLTLSAEKTKAMLFTRRQVAPLPLLLVGTRLDFVSDFRFLGVVLDAPRLTWKKHIEHVQQRSHKAINLLKAVSHHLWGADRALLYKLYNALVLSRLLYGSELYGSAAPTLLQPLKVIQNTALRIICGAKGSSPILSLEVETNVMPLHLQFQQQLLRYFNRLRQLPEHLSITNEIISDLHEQNNKQWTAGDTPPLVVRAFRLTLQLQLRYFTISPLQIVPPNPPWDDKLPVKDTLAQENLKIMPDNIVKNMFRDMASTEYADCCEIFTDGSKTGADINPTTVTAAMVVPAEGVVQTWKLPCIVTIFTAELYAIHEALLWAIQSPLQKFAVYTDSLSSVRLLMNSGATLRNTYRSLICTHFSTIKNQGKTLTIEWVPAHRGIPGNDTSDTAAKEAHSLPFITIPALPTQDIKHGITRALSTAWTDYWIQQRNNSRAGHHLAQIKQTIKEWPWASIPTNRKLETALSRLRIGHSGLNSHMYRMGMNHTPLCDCGAPETVEHALITCPNYDQPRQALAAAVQRLQQPMTVQILLGGSNVAVAEQKQIICAMNTYLQSTGLLNRV